jgi:serine/threonine-protein kinase
MENERRSDKEQQVLKIEGEIKNPYKQPDLPMPVPGDKIGPNKVLLLIGEGGSANVYKVWHEGLEVVRAVKILKKYQDKEARERFFTEAKILADIHHPNIVEIHNIGYVDQSIPFLEMEYIDGVSIKNLISQQTRLPVPVALSVAYFVSHALRYTHVKDYTLYGKVYNGLIHRDIKPDNIVISKDGIIKLMDFGIARPKDVSLHTVGAKIMGTLVYLSPEQLNGSQLDFKSDIFSLGTVLYEMLTGSRAFPQKTLTELVHKKSKAEFKPINSFGLNIPEQLNNIINRSMALSPSDRYGSSADFGRDLFAVFKTISDLAPQDILGSFMINPGATTQIPRINTSAMRSKKNEITFNLPVPIWAVAGAVIGGLALIWGLIQLF